ncbi:SCO2523 family variant P-loop protein [Actinoplanes utahensis]|uniref:DNA-binding protein n=1 Tax=Actinoplanes utahensis TaxID=1869 RepID=A0A0A6UFJ8_ACTUT|nr:SCO2523 family variant P-loop protein [Actinoplanes utahensis]KHD73094.1 DNA-binding protein [Actinoplanes utahensis]GIF34287.1 DNA-binding protein [Actinoplanes utahensis]
MFIFAASDKGGTGRSVTSSNLLYRSALQGNDVCYLDFDFGSPTAGAIFGIERAENGITDGTGMHSYLQRTVYQPAKIDVWAETDRPAVRHRPAGAGRLILLPGDVGGGDFVDVGGDAVSVKRQALVDQCLDLFLKLNAEFSLCLIDLSAGRNLAVELALRVTAAPAMRNITSRWLVFHRWTRQHVVAAGNLVAGPRGLRESAEKFGHDPEEFMDNLRFVRTAIIDPTTETQRGLSAKQGIWLHDSNERLNKLAGDHHVGRSRLLGSVPLDPMLQWQEQLITDSEVADGIANPKTRDAFNELAGRIVEQKAWETL